MILLHDVPHNYGAILVEECPGFRHKKGRHSGVVIRG